MIQVYFVLRYSHVLSKIYDDYHLANIGNQISSALCANTLGWTPMYTQNMIYVGKKEKFRYATQCMSVIFNKRFPRHLYSSLIDPAHIQYDRYLSAPPPLLCSRPPRPVSGAAVRSRRHYLSRLTNGLARPARHPPSPPA